MPATLSEDPSGRFVILTLTNPYSIAEARETLLRVLRHPVFQAHAALLIDRRAAAPPSSAFVSGAIDLIAEYRANVSGGRAAIVVADDVSFGMGRMTEMKAEMAVPTATIRAFRDYDAAVHWLMSA